MAREFNVPPVVFPSVSSQGVGPQQRRPPAGPYFQPPYPANNANLPFMSFEIGSTSASTSFSNPAFGNSSIGVGIGSGFEDEPPLLEELGINTRQIWRKTVSILNPFKVDPSLHEDADLAGPFIFIMLFGLFQLLAGKLHFGILFGWIALASMFLYFVFNNLAGHNGRLDLYRSLSIVGYCMLPIVMFSAVALFLPHGRVVLLSLAAVFVLWATRVCTRLLVELITGGEEHRGLIAYACFLIYSIFSLLVIF